MNTPKQYNIKVIPKKWWQIEYKVFLWYDKEDAKKEASSQWYQIISEDKDIQAVEYWKNDKPLFYSKKITKKDILLFFELFSNLTNLPPLKQVEILKKQTKKFIMKLFYDDLTTYISKWKSLHDIIEMPKWKKFFSHNQVELIKVWLDNKKFSWRTKKWVRNKIGINNGCSLSFNDINNLNTSIFCIIYIHFTSNDGFNMMNGITTTNTNIIWYKMINFELLISYNLINYYSIYLSLCSYSMISMKISFS